MSTYLLVNLLSILFPVLLSFDRKVHFIRRWPAALLSILPAGTVFVIWDVIATRRGDWSFNPAHVGAFTLFGLPLEEIMFFMLIPFSCIFIYECVICYRREREITVPRLAPIAAGVVFSLLAIPAFGRDYTFLAALACALFFLSGGLFFPTLFRSSNFWISMGIIYVPFAIVNGVLTGIPVVRYADHAITGVRVGTIPLEDFFYNLALIGADIALYRNLRQRFSR